MEVKLTYYYSFYSKAANLFESSLERLDSTYSNGSPNEKYKLALTLAYYNKIEKVNEIRQNAKTDIYLCGGGQFAGWLLENGLIDQLKLKLNPIVLGSGTRLFGSSTANESWELTEKESFSDGLQILTYSKKKKSTIHNNAYSLWRVKDCQQGFRFAASFGFGEQESASKPPQAICKPLMWN